MGAKAPGHQYPQWWLNIHCIGPVSYKNTAVMVNKIRKFSNILKKYPVVQGLMLDCSVFSALDFSIFTANTLEISFVLSHWFIN